MNNTLGVKGGVAIRRIDVLLNLVLNFVIVALQTSFETGMARGRRFRLSGVRMMTFKTLSVRGRQFVNIRPQLNR